VGPQALEDLVMTKQTEITLSSLYDCTDYKMRVLKNSAGGGVVFQIKKGDVLLDGITLTRLDALELASFLNSLLGEAPPEPAEPAYLAVFYSTPSGWAFHRVISKDEATIFAAKVKKEHPNRTVRLVNMLADYGLAEPIYEWKDF
jgi:hypothetical protein